MPSITEINLDELHLAWAEQPELYHKYAEKLAEAKFDLDEAKSALEITEAELFHEIKENFSNYGYEKSPSDVVAKMAVRRQRDFQDADERVNDCARIVGRFQAKVTTLDHRKWTLENLVKLVLADYFASPSMEGIDGKKAREYVENSTRATVDAKPKRRREEL